MPSLLLILILLLLFCILKLTLSLIWVPLRIQTHFKKQGISGPKYKIIFGNSKEIRRLFAAAAESKSTCINHDILHRVAPLYYEWSRKYGKTFLYWFGSKPRLAMSDPDMIKEILMNTSGSFENIPFNPQSKVLFGGGLVGLDGDKWALHRRITNQAFNMERVKGCRRFLTGGSCGLLLEVRQLGNLWFVETHHLNNYSKLKKMKSSGNYYVIQDEERNGDEGYNRGACNGLIKTFYSYL